MKFARNVFWIAAAYGFLIIVPLYFTAQTVSMNQTPATVHLEYYYSFAGVTLVWQILFLVISFDPQRYRAIMILCFLEKLSLVPTFALLAPQGLYPASWIPALIIDLALGILFLFAYSRVRREMLLHDKAAPSGASNPSNH